LVGRRWRRWRRNVRNVQTKPLAVDLYCGLGGWTEGLLAEGYDVIGFDIERHIYGDAKYPAQLVLQDTRTLHGSQFRDADLIVASPPCQKYSYMAMPWTLAKQQILYWRESPERLAELNCLFDQCFRIQREACEAAGRHIPMIVENTQGAQAWVGKASGRFGPYLLWGDVPALLPIAPGGRTKYSVDCGPRHFSDRDWTQDRTARNASSKSLHRKKASALLAKIPFALSSYIARTYYPRPDALPDRESAA
jgi:hypothetical protein